MTTNDSTENCPVTFDEMMKQALHVETHINQPSCSLIITRVPGGWLYTRCEYECVNTSPSDPTRWEYVTKAETFVPEPDRAVAALVEALIAQVEQLEQCLHLANEDCASLRDELGAAQEDAADLRDAALEGGDEK